MTDRITQADIVNTALQLLADGGLHALAMRRIATELGVQQSALYWHFDNKQHLLAAVADRVVAAVLLPVEGDWSERIESLASRLRRELLRYPDAAELVATVFAFRLGAQQPFQQFINELVRGRLAPDDAAIAASVLVYFVFGYATDEQQHHQAATLGAIQPDLEDPHAAKTADDRFLRGLRLIMGGVDAQLRATRGQDDRHESP
ncbi:MAG: TetR/AcrR family tetracycline transcriptional repressor [Ilumatobacter sp.]|jgi:TetR/AcrR family tetracycline transcriptional repressor